MQSSSALPTGSNERIGYWAANEQYPMSKLLEFVVHAEKRGFSATMTSDHFHPWWHTNARGNFTWVWIAAAAERTQGMKFTTGVTSPVYRYNPVIIAQAFASLDELYPGRVALGIGSGESLNEVPPGFDWPVPEERLARTEEAVQIIRKLWDGEFVDFQGKYFHIKTARLYSPPTTRIPLYIAASGHESARMAAKYSDGIITYLKPDEARQTLEAFDHYAKQNGIDPDSLEKIAEYKVSYSEDYEKALGSALPWRTTLIKEVFNTDIHDPRVMEEKGEEQVSSEDVKKLVDIVTDIESTIDSIESYFKAGYTRVHVHSTSPDEMEFLEQFCTKVLPYLKSHGEAEASSC